MIKYDTSDLIQAGELLLAQLIEQMGGVGPNGCTPSDTLTVLGVAVSKAIAAASTSREEAVEEVDRLAEALKKTTAMWFDIT